MKSGSYSKTITGHSSYPQQWSWHNAGQDWIVADPVYFGVDTYTIKSGYYNPNWKRDKGKTAVVSPYSYTHYERSSEGNGTTVFRQAYYFSGGNLLLGRHEAVMVGLPTHYDSGDDVTVETVDFTSADNLAKLQLSKRIVEEYRKFQGGTFLNELRETISMIRKPSRKLFDKVGDYLTGVQKRVRKIKPYRLSERTEMVRDTYLEATLGWTPLIADIGDIARAAAEMGLRGERDVEGLRSIHSGRFRNQVAVTLANSLPFPTPNLGTLPMLQHMVRKEIVDLQYTANCDRKVLYPKNELQALITLSGFSLREWVPTLWNCIPYSFIIDYFTNVGDVIEFYAADRSSIVALTRGVKRVTEKSFRYVINKPLPDNLWETNWSSSDLGSVQERRVDFDRTIVDPTLLDVKFSWENPLPKPKKFFNLVALASAIYNTNLNLRI